jgi:hypothetical protein
MLTAGAARCRDGVAVDKASSFRQISGNAGL